MPAVTTALCRCKHNYHIFTVNDGLYTDVNIPSIRPPSRRPLCRCKHNYHTITFNDGLNTDVNTTIERQPSRWPLCRCKHNYHAPDVPTASMQM